MTHIVADFGQIPWRKSLLSLSQHGTAELIDRVWILRQVVMYQVLPWPQPTIRAALGEANDREAELVRSACEQAKRAERGSENPIRRSHNK